jgi:hypothetical protein
MTGNDDEDNDDNDNDDDDDGDDIRSPNIVAISHI